MSFYSLFGLALAFRKKAQAPTISRIGLARPNNLMEKLAHRAHAP